MGNQVRGKITFLEETIFRYDVDPTGIFASYAVPREEAHTAKIQQCPDESEWYTKPEAVIMEGAQEAVIQCGATEVYLTESHRQKTEYSKKWRCCYGRSRSADAD